MVLPLLHLEHLPWDLVLLLWAPEPLSILSNLDSIKEQAVLQVVRDRVNTLLKVLATMVEQTRTPAQA